MTRDAYPKVCFVTMARTTLLFVASGCLLLTGCDPYHGFGCVAPESHPDVALARSLTADQWASAYDEVERLRDGSNPRRRRGPDGVPEALGFLEAEMIHVRSQGDTVITLAHCWDERIELEFSTGHPRERTISLSWAQPTRENSYATGSEVVWRGPPREEATAR
jgi:hypothetical protein